jgi:DNA polymerase III alpha subunit
VLGLSTGPHLLSFYQEWLAAQGMLDSRELLTCANGQRVQIAGLLVVHQAPPTVKGFHFLTLEDEQGLVNVVVRPGVYRRFRLVLRTARLLAVTGTVQQEVGVTNALAGRVVALDRETLA